MKVFLSHSLSRYDGALAARLRAVSLAYNVELILPTTEGRNLLPTENKKKIKKSDAVIVLLTSYAQDTQSVNLELQEANINNKPVLALVEDPDLIMGLPKNQIIVFNRHYPTQHESLLFEALKQIESQKNTADVVTALGAIGLVALGLLALSEFTKESNATK